jgi:hypothetical protein
MPLTTYIHSAMQDGVRNIRRSRVRFVQSCKLVDRSGGGAQRATGDEPIDLDVRQQSLLLAFQLHGINAHHTASHRSARHPTASQQGSARQSNARQCMTTHCRRATPMTTWSGMKFCILPQLGPAPPVFIVSDRVARAGAVGNAGLAAGWYCSGTIGYRDVGGLQVTTRMGTKQP